MYSEFLIKKNLIVLFLLIFALLITGMEFVNAQEKYPSRDVELILAFAPGGIIDLGGRIFADELSRVLKVAVTPINKPGATGITGTKFVLTTKKDGYTLLVNSISGLVITRYVLPDVPFVTLRDLVPISTINFAPSIIVVKNDSPFKSFDDLINDAKKNPGKLTYGTSGPGSDTHLLVEQLQDAAKIKFSHIPYAGGTESFSALMGGHVNFISNNLASASPHLKAGTVRALAVGQDNRNPFIPDVPTFREKGYAQHYIQYWAGVFVSKGTPKAAIDVLVSASEKVLKSKEYIKRIEDVWGTVQYLSPSEFSKLIGEDDKAIAAVTKKIGLKPKK